MSPRVQNTLQQAVGAHRAGRLTEAATLYARVLAAVPRNFDALHLAGLLAHQQGRHREATGMLERALRINPHSGVCAMRLGAAYLALGKREEAEAKMRDALRRQPDLAEAWAALALILQQQGRLSEARQACERALTFQPKNAEWLDRLGGILAAEEGFAAAEPWFRQAVTHTPGHLHGWINLGVALAMTHRPEEALPCFDRALELSPGHPHALTGRAVALERSYHLLEAVATYGEVLAKAPAHHEARSARLLSLHYLDEISPDRLAQEHREFGAQFPEADEDVFTRTWEPDRPLRLAIVSPDLRTHSVAYFLEPLLAHIDRSQFEVHLYHDHPMVDETSRRLQSLVAGWHHTSGLPHDVFVRRVRANAPDIAMDLAGHTAQNRLPAFAQRLAPVQISYLGYPNTTGLTQMDYRLTDAVCDPEGATESWHTEQLVRFAPTAWAYAPPPDAPEIFPPVGEWESNSRPITFGCFNNFSKVSDATLRLWSGVLAAVPGSRLLLKAHGLSNAGLRDRQAARLCACGIDPTRVDMLDRVPDRQAHLALYARVDVALDTFPYHGTTTTCEALWMGLPVVTRMGAHHAARVGGSLLTAIGHPEWVAEDETGFVRIAAALAVDRARLRTLRAGLRGEMQASALLQHAAQAEHFCAVLRACWQTCCNREASAVLAV